MKNLTIYSAAILMVLSFATAQAQDTKALSHNSKMDNVKNESKAEKREIRKMNKSFVSDLSEDAFYADFGKIPNVGWERELGFDIALFTKDGKDYKAYYDFNSKLVGTTNVITFAELPKKSQEGIKKHYKDYTVDKVIFFKDNEVNDQDMLLYGTQFSDTDNYFVEMSNKTKNIVVQTNPNGELFFFSELKKVL